MKDFLIEVCSDLDFEEMVADISYQNDIVARVTQENGIDKMMVELFPSNNGEKNGIFLLDEFIYAIDFAKKHLIEMNEKTN